MSELLQLTVIIALWCWGVYNAFREGQIFGKAGEELRIAGGNLMKPLISCMVCMPSVHGIYVSILMSESWLTSIFAIVCASGLNFIIKEHLYED